VKGQASEGSKNYFIATALISLIGIFLLLFFVPEPLVAFGFLAFIIFLLILLEGIAKLVRFAARNIAHHESLDGRFALRMALTALYRPGASLRPMLLSLGTALTLLVASAIVIVSTYLTLADTVPERAPSLVFYDLQKAQINDFNLIVEALNGYQEHSVAPLVLGRLTSVNGVALSDSTSAFRALEANDEHKLSYRSDNIDNTAVDRGSWWADDYSGPPLVAMEDREADQLDLQVGDTLEFTILNESVVATLSAIYTQARFETSFWLEAIFTDDVLDRIFPML